MTDDIKNHIEFQAKAFNTILDSMTKLRKSCKVCGFFTHDLTEDNLCAGCYSEAWHDFAHRHLDG